MHALELKIPPPVVAALACLLIWCSDRFLPGLTGQSVMALPLAIGLLICGAFCGIAAVYGFYAARTTIDPHRPENSTALVTTGIYAFSRNPMYLGLAFMIAGYAAHVANFAGGFAVLLFLLYVTRFQIIPEERVLADKFGARFVDYCNRTGRWLRL